MGYLFGQLHINRPCITLVEDVDEDTFANNCDEDDDDDGYWMPQGLLLGSKQRTDRVCSRRGWIPENMVADPAFQVRVLRLLVSPCLNSYMTPL